MSFHVAMDKRLGNRSLSGPSGSQLSCQNKHLSPSPKEIFVNDPKSSISAPLQGRLAPNHGLEAWYSNHFQFGRGRVEQFIFDPHKAIPIQG
jgi:hypothetical protein